MERGVVPCINLSLVKECMNRVTIRDARGTKPKDMGLGEELIVSGKKLSAKYIPILWTSEEGSLETRLSP